MNYKFKVGDLAAGAGPTPTIGLITARRVARAGQAEYTILIGGIPYMVWEYELTKVGE